MVVVALLILFAFLLFMLGVEFARDYPKAALRKIDREKLTAAYEEKAGVLLNNSPYNVICFLYANELLDVKKCLAFLEEREARNDEQRSDTSSIKNP